MLHNKQEKKICEGFAQQCDGLSLKNASFQIFTPPYYKAQTRPLRPSPG